MLAGVLTLFALCCTTHACILYSRTPWHAYDLMLACRDIGEGKLHVPELLGNVKIAPISPDGAYDTKLDSTRAQNDRVMELLRRYTNRKAFNSN